MNRRELLGTSALLAGSAFVGARVAPAQSVESPGSLSNGSVNFRPPTVDTAGGSIRGFQDGKTTTFLGIPYAIAGRFQLPKPVPAWEGVKSAQAWGPVCPMPEMTMPGVDEFVFPHRYWLQNEHCQVLNVWTQNATRTAKKPVMVWLHGGGFVYGSAMESYAYEGKNLSEFGDVVVVSLNHRLNILGTLDLSAYGAQYANSRYTGTADILAALQWIQANIEAFGGDPENVTVFGQSGGGGKVARLLRMPAAKGLLHKAVCESGGSNLYASADVAKSIETQQKVAAATLKNLNLTGDQIAQLQAVPYQTLLAAGNAALKEVGAQMGRNLTWDVVPDDKYVMCDFCHWSASVPLIAGSVFSEFIGNLQKGIDKNAWTAQQVKEHLTTAYSDRRAEVVAEFRKVFPRMKVQDVLFMFVSRPALKAFLAAKLKNAKAPVYNYLFTYEYPVNGGMTAFHTSELAFVFHNLSEPHMKVATGGTPAGFALQDKVSRAWVNFAYTGNPSQPGLVWKPFTRSDSETMLFDLVCECRDLKDDALMAMVPQQARR